jgi:hypothetical protein
LKTKELEHNAIYFLKGYADYIPNVREDIAQEFFGDNILFRITDDGEFDGTPLNPVVIVSRNSTAELEAKTYIQQNKKIKELIEFLQK